jgi:RNA polymerase sigma-70 factor (ECF subfamily)
MANHLTLKQLSDEELAVRAQAGSHRCFEELVYRYSQRLFYYLRAKIPTPQDAEDLVQETFFKTYRNIGRFDHQYKFSTWLYTTAARLAISFYRKKRADEATLEPACTSSFAADPSEKLIRQESRHSLWQAAQRLQHCQYEALWLRYVEELPVKEIAKVMNKSQIHVRVLLHRARLNLIKQINPSVLSGEMEEVTKEEVECFVS